MDRSTIRETGTGESSRPTPSGNFDGLTKAEALRRLLAKDEPPAPSQERRNDA